MANKSVEGYSTIQITLHWLIVAAVLFQLVFGESMTNVVEALEEGATPGAGDLQLSSAHFWVGIAILVLLVLRLAVRMFTGTPEVIGAPGLMTLAASAMHWLFYALLVAVPVTGLLAKYVGDPWGDIHTIGKPIFIVLIVLHAAAALYHHFLLKDETLVRMLKPRRS
ncbi:MAG: cytochrome b562 [Proteobacteria bacterium]|nr:cytochrome b562 [Pseudomonadota bacterium]